MYKKLLVLLWAMPLSASQHDNFRYKEKEAQAIASLSQAITNDELVLRQLKFRLKQTRHTLENELKKQQPDMLCLHGLKIGIEAFQKNRKSLKEKLVRNQAELSLRENVLEGKFKKRCLRKRPRPGKLVVQKVVPQSFETIFQPVPVKIQQSYLDATSSDCDSAGEQRTSRSKNLPHKKS